MFLRIFRVLEKDYKVYFDNHSTLLRIHQDDLNETHGGGFYGKIFLKEFFPLKENFPIRNQERPRLVKNCH